jgi:outer membrane protein TolC
MEGDSGVNRLLRGGLLAAMGVVLAAGAIEAQEAAPADTLRVGVKEAVALALRDGVEAAMARQDVANAEAQVLVARSYALPELTATGTYTRNLKKPVIFFEFEPGQTEQFEIGQDNAWLGMLNLRQVLWASGRVGNAWKSAQAQAAAARAAGDDTAAAIARDVRSAYYLALLAGEQAHIARESLRQAQRTLDQIREQVDKGVTPEFDRVRAAVTVASRRPQVTRAENGEAIARDALKRLLGVPLRRPIALTDPLRADDHGGTLEQATAQALHSRRDLEAVKEQLRAADLRQRAQSANDRPSLYLDGNLQWQGETSDGLWPGERESAASASVGLTLSWPIFDGLRNRYQTRAAEAVAAKARLQVRFVEDAVRLEVRSRWSDVESIAEEIDAARETVDLASQAYDIARARYRSGLSTLVELQDAELALVQARVSLSETLYRYNVAVAELDYSTGNGPVLMTSGEE